jgi:hypothetical protein
MNPEVFTAVEVWIVLFCAIKTCIFHAATHFEAMGATTQLLTQKITI